MRKDSNIGSDEFLMLQECLQMNVLGVPSCHRETAVQCSVTTDNRYHDRNQQEQKQLVL